MKPRRWRRVATAAIVALRPGDHGVGIRSGLLDRLKSVASRAGGDPEVKAGGRSSATLSATIPSPCARRRGNTAAWRSSGRQARRLRGRRKRRALPRDRSDPGAREGRRSRDRPHRDRHRDAGRSRGPDQLLRRRADVSGGPHLDGRDFRDRDPGAGVRALLRRHAHERAARPRLGNTRRT